MLFDYLKKSLTLFFLFEILIFFMNDHGCISYAYTLLLFSFFNYFTDKRYWFRNLYAFHFFLLMSFIVYEVQLLQYPTQLGLTSGKDDGTDDATYYYAISDVYTNVFHNSELDYYFFVKFIKFVYPFTIIDPINIIIFNILIGLTFLPYFTAKVAEVLFNSTSVSKVAFILMCFCPFTMSVGLIIMRDVPGALCIIASFYFFIKRKYFLSFIFGLILINLKFGFIAYLIVAIMCYVIVFLVNKRKRIYLILLFVVVLFILFQYVLPNLENLSEGRMNNGSLFRTGIYAEIEETNKKSMILTISRQPLLLRLPLLIIAFMTMPMLTFGINIVNGLPLPRELLQKLYPLYVLFFSKHIFDVFLIRKKDNSIKMIIAIVLLLALSLGMISLIIRHKVIMMPFFYVLAAYGISKTPSFKLSSIFQVIFIIANFMYAILKYG